MSETEEKKTGVPLDEVLAKLGSIHGRLDDIEAEDRRKELRCDDKERERRLDAALKRLGDAIREGDDDKIAKRMGRLQKLVTICGTIRSV